MPIKLTKCTVEKEPVYEGEELVDMETVFEDVQDDFQVDTFEELLFIAQDCPHRSDSGTPSEWTWIYDTVDDYETGGFTETSYHFNGKSHQIKYWRKALQMGAS